MKQPDVYKEVNRTFIIALLFAFIALAGFNTGAQAQGWTFTFQLAKSGPCQGANLPVLPTFPNLGIPTQTQCESLRQTILNVTESVAVYDNHGNHIGDCKLFYTCTPCTGSDVNTSGLTNPGDVSFDGQFQGKPFFTPHQSEAFEDWAKDYKQQLESYGITSILGNTLNAFQIPLTGDKDFDQFYSSKSADFNPAPPANNLPYQDADVVDLSGKKGIVQSPSNADDQKKRDDWMEENGLNNDLSQMNSTNVVDGNSPAGQSVGEAALRALLGSVSGLEGAIGTFGTNAVDETFSDVNQAVGYLASGNDAAASEFGNNLMGGLAVRNTASKTTKDLITGKFNDFTQGNVSETAMSFVPGGVGKLGKSAVEIGTVVGNTGLDFWGNLTGK